MVATCTMCEQRKSDSDRRAPTPAEVAAFDGGQCRELWRALPAGWRCPACRRDKAQIMHWGRPRPGAPWRWTAALARHHDHAAPGGLSRASLLVWGPVHEHPAPRFPVTVICGQCNTADAVAKRVLCLPERYSFAPDEIARFVTATPHGRHTIDYDVARRMWEEHARLLPPRTRT
jgi:rubredoxin